MQRWKRLNCQEGFAINFAHNGKTDGGSVIINANFCKNIN